MLWHRQAIFGSKGDKLLSAAECTIRTQGLWNRISSRLNARCQSRATKMQYTFPIPMWNIVNFRDVGGLKEAYVGKKTFLGERPRRRNLDDGSLVRLPQ